MHQPHMLGYHQGRPVRAREWNKTLPGTLQDTLLFIWLSWETPGSRVTYPQNLGKLRLVSLTMNSGAEDFRAILQLTHSQGEPSAWPFTFPNPLTRVAKGYKRWCSCRRGPASSSSWGSLCTLAGLCRAAVSLAHLPQQHPAASA